jgi:hypothetical protein
MHLSPSIRRSFLRKARDRVRPCRRSVDGKSVAGTAELSSRERELAQPMRSPDGLQKHKKRWCICVTSTPYCASPHQRMGSASSTRRLSKGPEEGPAKGGTGPSDQAPAPPHGSDNHAIWSYFIDAEGSTTRCISTADFSPVDQFGQFLSGIEHMCFYSCGWHVDNLCYFID